MSHDLDDFAHDRRANHALCLESSDRHLADLLRYCTRPRMAVIPPWDSYGRQPMPEPPYSPTTSYAALCAELDTLGPGEPRKL